MSVYPFPLSPSGLQTVSQLQPAHLLLISLLQNQAYTLGHLLKTIEREYSASQLCLKLCLLRLKRFQIPLYLLKLLLLLICQSLLSDRAF